MKHNKCLERQINVPNLQSSLNAFLYAQSPVVLKQRRSFWRMVWVFFFCHFGQTHCQQGCTSRGPILQCSLGWKRQFHCEFDWWSCANRDVRMWICFLMSLGMDYRSDDRRRRCTSLMYIRGVNQVYMKWNEYEVNMRCTYMMWCMVCQAASRCPWNLLFCQASLARLDQVQGRCTRNKLVHLSISTPMKCRCCYSFFRW